MKDRLFQLHQAASSGDLTKLKRLFDPDLVNEYYKGETLLHAAITNDRAPYDYFYFPNKEQSEVELDKVVDYLLEHGANPLLPIIGGYNNGKTSFDLAKTWERLSIIHKSGIIDRASCLYTAELVYPVFKKRYPEQFQDLDMNEYRSKRNAVLFSTGALLAIGVGIGVLSNGASVKETFTTAYKLLTSEI